MSTPKTPDNATVVEPIESAGHKRKRQEAKGRKTVARAKSREAGRAKERTMPRNASRRRVAKFLLKKLSEANCEQYGISKVDISRLREVANGAREKYRRS
jgi:hypothetical protein